MTIYLYKKTHKITGLKYLGKTTAKDPHRYKGSGKIWIRHIKKYGYDVETEILKECDSKEEVKEWGLYYSHLWDVVNSKEWANLIVESGDGGAMLGKLNPMHDPIIRKRHAINNKIAQCSLSTRRKKSELASKRWSDPDFRKRTSLKIKKSHNTEEARKKKSVALIGHQQKKIVCPHCGKEGGNNMKRYHFDKCPKQ